MLAPDEPPPPNEVGILATARTSTTERKEGAKSAVWSMTTIATQTTDAGGITGKDAQDQREVAPEETMDGGGIVVMVTAGRRRPGVARTWNTATPEPEMDAGETVAADARHRHRHLGATADATTALLLRHVKSK